MTGFFIFLGLLCSAFVALYVLRKINRQKLAMAVGPKLGAFRAVSTRFEHLNSSVTDSQLIELRGKLLLKFDDPHEAAIEDWVRTMSFRLPFEEYKGKVNYGKDGPPKETKIEPLTDEEVLEICADFKFDKISDLVFEGVIAPELGKKYVDRMAWMIEGYILESGQSLQAVPGFQMFIKQQYAKMESMDSGSID
jgi:hypothetical protein